MDIIINMKKRSILEARGLRFDRKLIEKLNIGLDVVELPHYWLVIKGTCFDY